jgi:hypothetical protein
MNFNFRLPSTFIFFTFHENGLHKCCSSFEDVSVYNISWSFVDWFKFYIHLRSLNVNQFGMVEAVGLNNVSRSPSMA